MGDDFSYQFYDNTIAAWDGMYQALLGAKKSIYWELFIMDDEAGEPFIKLLCSKAKQGVDVKLILDAYGSRRRYLSHKNEIRLKQSGVDLLWYGRYFIDWNLRRWAKKFLYRNHRKVLIIDEEVVFLGGVNLSEDSRDWYDLHLRLTGNAVFPLLKGFARTYVQVGGDEKNVHDFLRPRLMTRFNSWKKSIGNQIDLIVHAPLYPQRSSVYHRIFWQGLNKVKNHFTIVSPYYVPDDNFLRYVRSITKRGKVVDIILPQVTDDWFMRRLASTYYDVTVKAGANIYLNPRMNHGKAFCVDNNLGTMGSCNFTPRGFYMDQEAGVKFSNQSMLTDFGKILNKWKDESILLSEVGKREQGLTARFKSYLFQKMKDYV